MKTQLTIIACVMAMVSMLVGCSKTGGLKEGGIYSFKNDNGTYSVLKLLKVESGGAHIRIFSNQFDAPPTSVDETKLYMAGMDHKPTETQGVADMPVSGATLENYHLTFVQQSTVSPEELEGYNTWKKSGGKYY